MALKGGREIGGETLGIMQRSVMIVIVIAALKRKNKEEIKRRGPKMTSPESKNHTGCNKNKTPKISFPQRTPRRYASCRSGSP